MVSISFQFYHYLGNYVFFKNWEIFRRIYRSTKDDYSARVLKTWVEVWQSQYHSINITTGNATEFKKLANASSTEQKYRYIINLREEALEIARRSWADYIWVIKLVFPTESICLV